MNAWFSEDLYDKPWWVIVAVIIGIALAIAGTFIGIILLAQGIADGLTEIFCSGRAVGE
jgi:hypothetical protein